MRRNQRRGVHDILPEDYKSADENDKFAVPELKLKNLYYTILPKINGVVNPPHNFDFLQNERLFKVFHTRAGIIPAVGDIFGYDYSFDKNPENRNKEFVIINRLFSHDDYDEIVLIVEPYED